MMTLLLMMMMMMAIMMTMSKSFGQIIKVQLLHAAKHHTTPLNYMLLFSVISDVPSLKSVRLAMLYYFLIHYRGYVVVVVTLFLKSLAN